MIARAFALLLAASTLSACAGQQTSKADKLQEAVDAYNYAFRWKNFERAVMFIPKDNRSDFLAAYEDDQESLQVDEWSVRGVKWEGDNSAAVSIRMTYLLLPSTMVKNVTLVQHWAEVNGEWIIQNEEDSIRKLGEKPSKGEKPKPKPKAEPDPTELPNEPEFK